MRRRRAHDSSLAEDFMTRNPFARRAALTLLALGIAAACRSGDIASLESPGVHAADRRPESERDKPGSDAPRGVSTSQNKAAVPVVCAKHGATVNVGVFGPSGGTLVFGNSRLVIPGGALHDTVTISATIPADSSSTVEFQPHGLQFYKPAGLVLDGSTCSLPADMAPRVVYLSDGGDVLEIIEAVYDPHWKTVAAPIVHFSGYAIAF